jgi:hypothetical protein
MILTKALKMQACAEIFRFRIVPFIILFSFQLNIQSCYSDVASGFVLRADILKVSSKKRRRSHHSLRYCRGAGSIRSRGHRFLIAAAVNVSTVILKVQRLEQNLRMLLIAKHTCLEQQPLLPE